MSTTGSIPYSYGAVSYDKFEDLLSESGGVNISDQSFRDVCFRRGRVLVQAHAGAGKSTLLRRVSKLPTESNVESVFLDLPSCALIDPGEVTLEKVESWLRGTASSSPSTRTLVFIDGLDEFVGTAAQTVLDAVEEFTRAEPRYAVVLADRLTRRDVNFSRWALFGLSSIDNSEPQSQGSNITRPTWAVLPFYKKLVDDGFSAHSGPYGIIDEYFRSINGSDDHFEIADSAFKWWTQAPSITNDRSWFEHEVGELVSRRLVDRGLLVDALNTGGEGVEFSHLLIHSYLASTAVSSTPSLWRRPTFEALTMQGASFEALALLCEQIPDQAVDELVRAVDDWNFYAAAHLLGEDFAGSNRIGGHVRLALLFALGLRRFGPARLTSLNVEDALRLHGGEIASALLAAESLESVFSVVRTRLSSAELLDPEAGDWWHEWLDIVSMVDTTETGLVVFDYLSLLPHIESMDGIIGWTAANIAALAQLPESAVANLRNGALSHSNDVVRWRYAHVLGGIGHISAFEVALRSFSSDSSGWVRYGALRSCILILAKIESESNRSDAFESLASLADQILANPKFAREIERCSEIHPPPRNWADSVGILIEALWGKSSTVDEQDRWRRVSASLRNQTGSSGSRIG